MINVEDQILWIEKIEEDLNLMINVEDQILWIEKIEVDLILMK